MAGSQITAKLSGLPDLRQALLSIPDKLRRRELRKALAAGARVVQRAIRPRVPVLAAPIYRRGQLARKPGTVRDAVRVRTSKLSSRRGDVGVFVSVVPAKGAKFRTVRGTALFGLVKTKSRVQTRASQRGAYSPNDPYYWRFINFATRRNSGGAHFMESGAAVLPAAQRAIEISLAASIRKLNVKGL